MICGDNDLTHFLWFKIIIPYAVTMKFSLTMICGDNEFNLLIYIFTDNAVTMILLFPDNDLQWQWSYFPWQWFVLTMICSDADGN